MERFAPGQVWVYKTRNGESVSRLVVCRVESDAKLGALIHIHVKCHHFRNRRAPGGYSETIGHMPYSAEALQNSVSMLESTGTGLPSFEDGYDEWRMAADQGRAGVWTIPVAEAIAAMESAVNK